MAMRQRQESAQENAEGVLLPDGMTSADVRAELDRIFASPAFDASDRNRRFLEHVVEETLAGRGERIKAYGVALAVFGRDESFDAQSDPIVRIEASRLRRSLERYYLIAGQDDPVRIDIPKGGYVAAFDIADGGAERSAETVSPPPGRPGRLPLPKVIRLVLPAIALLGIGFAGGWTLGANWSGPAVIDGGATAGDPVVLAMPFQDDGSPTAGDGLVHGFSREVVAGLTRSGGLVVFDAEMAERALGEADEQILAKRLGADFLLTGGMSVAPDRFAVTASLTDSASGRQIWSGQFDGDVTAASIIAVRDRLAGRVVQELAQPYGVLYSEQLRHQEGKPPVELTSYECVLRFRQYWREPNPLDHGPIRQCLERTVEADPDYAEAQAALAMLLADGYRLGFDPAAAGRVVLPRALALARRAVELAPTDSQSYAALFLVYWLMNDVERSLAAGQRGLALNPNDTVLLAEVSRRYCMRGMFDLCMPMMEEAFARNPILPGHYRIGPYLARYMAGDYAAALIEARRIGIPDTVFGHMALAMAHAKLGHAREARAAVERVLEIDPAYGEHLRQDLAKRNLAPELIEAIASGMRLAGLDVAEAPAAPDGRPAPAQHL